MIPRAAAVALVLAASAAAQPPTRRLTTIEAIREYPGFFHLQAVVLRGELSDAGGRTMLRSDESEMRIVLDDQVKTLDGPIELRAQMIDVGRLEAGDPRLGRYERQEQEGWPRPGEELILRPLGISSAPAAATPSVRALALEPWKFEGQTVTLTGQFRGRNLFGDQPDAPKKSRYDFVLKAADASVWVTGLRPRGRGFDLNVDARVDTSSWVEVSGAVKRERGLVTIEAAKIAAAAPPKATTEPEEPAINLPPPPPIEVVFSSPTEGETDVSVNSPIRIQFSRSVEPETLKGRIRIGYLRAESAEKGEPQAPAVEVKTTYDPGTRALELRFTQPLERFRRLRVELLEGIKGFDGAPVVPWTLTFAVGG